MCLCQSYHGIAADNFARAVGYQIVFPDSPNIIAEDTYFIQSKIGSERVSEILPVNAGIPQGSPILPILFLFINAPLNEECANSGLKIQVGGFVDDVHLIVYGTSTDAGL